MITHYSLRFVSYIRPIACHGIPVMLLLSMLVTARAHPNGYDLSCNENGYTLPTGMGYYQQTNTYIDAMTCDGLNCTLTYPDQFKGIVLSSTSPLSSADNQLRTGYSSKCLTHEERTPKTSVTFSVQDPHAVVYAVLVSARNVLHSVILVHPIIVGVNWTTHVIGAGPGGVSAARTLKRYGAPVIVYERGPDVPAGFYDLPIYQTTRTYFIQNLNTSRTCNPLGNATQPTLVCQHGGNQNSNGAIFAPGSPEDFARSIGVPVETARYAQAVSINYIDVDNDIFMWYCPNGVSCDRRNVADSNPVMNRRSVAYQDNLTNDIVFGQHVKRVTNQSITFQNDTYINFTNPRDQVILAAGALVSPQHVGKTQFTGWNHPYKISYQAGNLTSQTLSYNPETKVETNDAILTVNGTETKIRIEILMEHSIRETFTVGQDYTPSNTSGFIHDTWHYAGTLPHDALEYSPGIYVGDASALQTPFNCHTSMPASSAGVLAALRSLGLLQQTEVPSSTQIGGLSKVGAWFAAGSVVLLLAVAAHVWGLWKTHYILATTGVILITIGVVVAANQRNADIKKLNKGHYWVGYVSLVWLWLQAAAGYLLTQVSPEQKKRYGWVHRVSAVLLFALLLYLYATVGTREAPFKHMEDNKDWAGVAWAFLVLFSALIVVVLWRLPARMNTTPIESFSDVLKQLL